MDPRTPATAPNAPASGLRVSPPEASATDLSQGSMTSLTLVLFAAGLTLLVKLILAAAVPMTQDEAYFVMWGAYPSLGYSEHPPLIGWIEMLILQIGRHPMLVRLPAVLGTIAIGLGLYWVLRGIDRGKAALAACLYLLSPLSLAYVIVTTDTALIVSSFASAAFLLRALRGERRVDYALAGVFLGCALLSKFFAALLALSYIAVFLFCAPKTRRSFTGFALTYLCAFPFGLIILYWNYTHSWMEVRYPSYRDDDAHLSLVRPLTFLAIQLYLLIPVGLVYLVRERTALWNAIRGPVRLFAVLFIVPLTVMALLALRKSVGLHWVLSYYAFAYPVAAFALPTDRLRRALRFNAWFSVGHVLLVVVAVWIIALGGSKTLLRPKDHGSVVISTEMPKLREALQPYLATHRFAADGYGIAALLDYALADVHVAAWGLGNHHVRNDDFVTDFNEWGGQRGLVFSRRPLESHEIEPFFDTLEFRSFDIEGATFHLALGEGFRLDAYRERFLAPIRDRYFDIPSWMPVEECYFRKKYFSGE